MFKSQKRKTMHIQLDNNCSNKQMESLDVMLFCGKGILVLSN